MARSTLPTFPLVVFGIIEPVLLVWAYIVGMRDPLAYFANQVPGSGDPSARAAAFSPEAVGVTLQLLNVLLLLAPLAVVCSFSRDPATVKGYLAAVALADYGHIYATYRSVGDDVFFNPSQWNDMVGANVGVSAVLNVLRLLTLFGAFGPVVARDAGERKRKDN
ncbi:hypothetical protein NEMBOFW57_006739 [Staphylotrichum longicolle]|uniref:DUF7704 domain-containing protein n=1 Tax=Staphylotrichum longicolle TaxID=669026 RepID=A0AAD4ETC5_9PEZI|nr:hypothetical protein NEMBOFW57_006739 [Staphylotrichum longicolle]